MTTLLDNELFDYLAHLEGEVRNLQQNYSSEDFRYRMHNQMRKIISSERRFLETIHGNTPTLAFAGNGLPTIESLKPDLESMTQLADDDKAFRKIAETYKPISQEQEQLTGKQVSYKEVSEDEHKEQLKSESRKNNY